VRRAALLLALIAGFAAIALGAIAIVGNSPESSPVDHSRPAPHRPRTASDSPRASSDRARRAPDSPRRPPLPASHCPPASANCKTASGQIIYVERVDPDGDGDAHFVLTSRQSITLPGISVIDVEKSVRPDPLPVEGDWVSAAGPVYRGSYGQSQIQATELHVARASRSTR
jgi:hypothetical protein